MAKRGKIPSLIAGCNGKPSLVEVHRKRKCTRCSTDIVNGSKCFAIPRIGGGFSNQKPYCFSCFREVLSQTRTDLEELENLLQ